MPHWSEAYSVQYFLIIASDELFLLFRPVEFNPRSPCGERRDRFNGELADTVISIHAPRVGSDFILFPSTVHPSNFNPRSPCGERPSTFCYQE